MWLLGDSGLAALWPWGPSDPSRVQRKGTGGRSSRLQFLLLTRGGAVGGVSQFVPSRLSKYLSSGLSKWRTWAFRRLVPPLRAFTRAAGEAPLIHLWFNQGRKALMLCQADTVPSLLTSPPHLLPANPAHPSRSQRAPGGSLSREPLARGFLPRWLPPVPVPGWGPAGNPWG